jgi:hypothetical protein
VKGREHDVTRRRCLQSQVGGLVIPDLSDQDHIRIMAKKCTGEISQARLGADLLLVDLGNLVFNGIFCCQDLPSTIIEVGKRWWDR